MKHPNAEKVQLVRLARFQVVFFKWKNKEQKENHKQVMNEMIQNAFLEMNLASYPEKHQAWTQIEEEFFEVIGYREMFLA
jgi:hypothetical protein